MLDLVLTLAPHVFSAVGVSALGAAILPRPSAESGWAKVFALLDFVAANWMNARNGGPK